MTEQRPEPRLVTVADGVHAWIGAGGDSNAGAIETPEGLLIVDTQQYPRLGRALREAALAYHLTRRCSKERILRNYLNSIYFGNGAYGIETAAETYFHKAAKQLTLRQAALPAGINAEE